MVIQIIRREIIVFYINLIFISMLSFLLILRIIHFLILSLHSIECQLNSEKITVISITITTQTAKA